MKKTLSTLLALAALAANVLAAAGTYSKTRFYRDVEVGSWTTDGTLTVTPTATSSGLWFSAAGQTNNYYRIRATNDLGWFAAGLAVTNHVRAWSATTNALALSWAARDGAQGYVVEYSADGTNFLKHHIAGNTTAWTDNHVPTDWIATAYTTVHPVSARAPSVPWVAAAVTTTTTLTVTTASPQALHSLSSVNPATPIPAVTNSGYYANDTLRIYASFSWDFMTLDTLLYAPTLPAGWTIVSAQADDTTVEVGPVDEAFPFGSLLFASANLPYNPLYFSYLVSVPAGQTGEKTVRATVEYQGTGMSSPATLVAYPSLLMIACFTTTTSTTSTSTTTTTSTTSTTGETSTAGTSTTSSSSTTTTADTTTAETTTATPTTVETTTTTTTTASVPHTADYRTSISLLGANWKLDTTEVNRVLAIWRNVNGYHNDAAQPDKFAAGLGDRTGAFHDADWRTTVILMVPNWKIDTTEVNRCLAIWRNVNGYHVDATQPDGFAAGAAE